MKRLLSLVLCLGIVFTITACGKDDVENEKDQWPENEFTSLVSKPEFGELNGAVEIENEFCISINETKIDDVKLYVEKIKQAGFIEKEEVIDEEAMGVEVYSYMAENTQGCKVFIEYSVGVCSMTITK